MSEKDLKAAAFNLLVANPSMSEVFMASNGQGFADKHDAEVMNDKLGLRGKEGGAVKVKREGNEEAIEALAAEVAEAHEKAVAASRVEQARIREEKKALKAAKKLNRKGADTGIGDEALKTENAELKARIAELEKKPAAKKAAPKKDK